MNDDKDNACAGLCNALMGALALLGLIKPQ